MPRTGTSMYEELERSLNFGDIFELVKSSVDIVLKQRRAGLMLYLVDLPRSIGALHQIDSNAIIMNRSILNDMVAFKSKQEINAFIYSILLHEYLHSLGYKDELEVRRLTYMISKETLGENHIATRMARNPSALFPSGPHKEPENFGKNIEIIADFDRSSQRYYI